ncbi:hypothetical protein I545_6955 [Mycobacterium kansasii 662]|uniref:Anti-sigma-D factor RsdA sigma factor binding region domain-containing protein n=1 Tax=Mycobacterium kansasii 662 TaxID=1299326 RepID=X7XQR1_MYCKA|nr:hypothetical protein I545_6955 [Mycobacterium kansasii 662]
MIPVSIDPAWTNWPAPSYSSTLSPAAPTSTLDDPHEDALAALLGQWRDDLRGHRPALWSHPMRPSRR